MNDLDTAKNLVVRAVNQAKGDPGEAANIFWSALRGRPKPLHAVAGEFFFNTYRELDLKPGQKPPPTKVPLTRTIPTPRQQEAVVRATAEEIRKRHDASVERARAFVNNLIVAGLKQANGKAFRDCTFAEIGTFGKRYSALAGRGNANEVVGEKFTDDQIQKAVVNP